jgi:hypothetical protein
LITEFEQRENQRSPDAQQELCPLEIEVCFRSQQDPVDQKKQAQPQVGFDKIVDNCAHALCSSQN